MKSHPLRRAYQEVANKHGFILTKDQLTELEKAGVSVECLDGYYNNYDEIVAAMEEEK